MSGLSEGFTNGPSSQKDTQMWERPWTLEEMRQNSANWSLAADSGLFLFLQDFSQRMLSKTHEIEKQLDSLIRDTKATDSRLHSVFNDFLMLSNTQFIENRVYDEEVEENIPKTDGPEKQPEQEKTREQKEAELIPKMQEAVNYGLKVLDSAFEHLDIKAGNSDSEDEEVTDKVEAILEPKDLYVDRPLPYLIGSQAFMEQDDVGLGDLSSDEVSVDSDRDSVLESEDGIEVAQSDEDLDQEEEISHNNIKKKSSMVSYDEEDEDSDIFRESDRDDNEDDEDNTGNTGRSSFAEELAARIKGDAVIKVEGDRASLASKKKSKSRKESKPSKLQAEEDDDDMFKPPEMDDDDFSPFGGKGGLFSGGRGLFDDDDESDLFSEAPKLPASEDKNLLNESLKSTAHAAESDKPGKKIPAGGISVFPENNLLISGKDSDSVGSKENGTPAPTRQPPSGAGFGGGGLFEDDDDDDDFFGGKSTKKSASAGPEKTKKSVDLFADDDEDGDIFSEKYSTPAQSKKDGAAEPTKHPEKKMPAGAISMFGPGTKSLLSEGLKKHHLSTSEESEKSENGPTQDVGKAAVKQPQKPQTRGLFSDDDEDAPAFPAIPKSRSKPEPTSQGKTSKAASLLFDDEEEEDLFATAVKSNTNSNQAKASTLQPTKAVSSSLFSDDEQDQWMTSKSSAGKPEVKSGGMKPSTSAPSRLPSAKPSHSSLFVDADDEDDDDLFAPKQEPSQKKPQRVSLLFEDEDDDYNGSLFGIKSAVNKNAAPPANTPPASSQTSSHVDKWEKVAAPAEDKPLEQSKPTTKGPETGPSSPLTESEESKKKSAGGVSLFEGIDVVSSKQTKLLDEANDADGFLSRDSPPLTVKKEEKATRNIFSLFDEEEEDESDWNKPIFTSSKPNTKNTLKPAEEQPQAKSTGVFQDEELLFSQTQQKDNDPDVDLFATSGKASSSKVSLAKPATQSLFVDEDEEDDLFSSVKPKSPPPKVLEKPSKPDNSGSNVDSLSQKPASSPLKAKESSSRIGKLQASLLINPAALLPGATPILPGAVSVLPGAAPKSSAGTVSSSPDVTPMGAQTGSEQGVSFDAPVQVTTLQSVHKTRAKIAGQRRPQSRAARQQAAKTSAADEDAVRSNSGPSGLVLPTTDKSSQAASTDFPAASVSSVSEVTPRPLILTLPGTKTAGKDKSAKGSNSTNVLQTTEDDLFASDDLFVSTLASDAPPTTKTTQRQAVGDAGLKKDKERSTFPSIFEDNSDDLFQTSKPRLTNKKVKAASFLEEDDDNEDIFVSNTSTPTSTSSKEFKNSSSYSKLDIFQDEVTTVPKVEKKHKKTTDASLFDDNIDIFADLTDPVKPKQKSKSKGETRSIFNDNMDDIFSSSTIKPVTKVSSKAKKTPVIQETSTAAASGSIFDDPLNAIGGN